MVVLAGLLSALGLMMLNPIAGTLTAIASFAGMLVAEGHHRPTGFITQTCIKDRKQSRLGAAST